MLKFVVTLFFCVAVFGASAAEEGDTERLVVAMLGQTSIIDDLKSLTDRIANLVAAQKSANYASNYHASSDTFENVDQKQLKLNSAIAAVGTLGFSNADIDWKRQSRDEIEALITVTDLAAQMRAFAVWGDWADGKRGREK